MGFVKAPTELIKSLREAKRTLSKQEAHLILTDDMNLNRAKKISEYSREWKWSRRTVRRFLTKPPFPFDSNGLWCAGDIITKYAHPKPLNNKGLEQPLPTCEQKRPPQRGY